MNRAVFTGAAMLIGLSSAAFAQSAANPAPTPVPAPQAKSDKSAPSQMASADNSANGGDIQQQMTNDLQHSGYTNVKVIPDSFIVQANDKAGNLVTMLLSPNSATEVTDVEANRQKSGTDAAGGMFASIPAKDDLTSKIVGLDVYNKANQDIGTIKDVAYNGAGVRAYIVGVGGFLGMGDHYVAVRPSAINLSYNAADKKWRAVMDANADQLKGAPEYKYSSNS
jgi:hypothetical protein